MGKPITIGQSHNLISVLANNVCWDELDAKIVQQIIDNPQKAGRQFSQFLKNGVSLVRNTWFRLDFNIARDMTGWECVESVETKKGEFQPVLQEFLQREDNGYLNGEEVVKRAKEQGVLTGLRHAEAMLRNQERIPVEWREYVLVFPEVWQSPGGGRCVLGLCWDGDHWYLYYVWLDRDFNSRYRLVALRK